MILAEKHLKAIDLIIEGKNLTDISKILKVSRTSIYNWLKDKEFNNELNKRKQEIKSKGMDKMLCELELHLNNISNLALNSASDAVRLNASSFYVEHVLGKATTKIEATTESKEDEKDINMDEILAQVDNIVDISSKRKDV
ncbi:helix-turn-helix domain-containing protein [Clostridium perfringens]|uniref:IS630 transposase-related protein n=1 Tax=Clostridium perfringens TaxID=1502 RepID=UPI001ABA1C41|nr:helix-turn-helix domain-containing protein [Clostridium perfringens]MBO3388425.1 helix-turn-helix domain-containing protein [Clostridium perfringens]MBO3414855.1 helix-turn-helix domain-containing protein [Clostridium perfringens]